RAQRTLKFTPLRSALRPLRQSKRGERTARRYQQVLATIEHVRSACCRSQWESKLVMPEVFSASRIECHEVAVAVTREDEAGGSRQNTRARQRRVTEFPLD